LSFSWPATPLQSPLNMGDENYQPLFAYGYGLTYQDVDSQDVDSLSDELSEEAASVIAETDAVRKVFDNRPLEPWQLVITDARNNTSVVTGSSATLDTITLRSVDRHVQEDSRRVQWNGAGGGKVEFLAQQRSDLSSYFDAQGAMVFDVKVDAQPTRDVHLGMSCGQDCLAERSITEVLTNASGDWTTISISLECFTHDRLRTDMVLSPFYIRTGGSLDLTFHNVRIEKNTIANFQCN